MQPRDLPRGPDIAIPHVEGRTLVAGEERVTLPAARVELLGAAGSGFIVAGGSEDGLRRKRIWRVQPGRERVLLLRGGDVWTTAVSRDGRHLVRARALQRRRTRVTVWSARSGDRLHRHLLRGYVDLLDADGGRALVSEWRSGTSWLQLRTGRLRRVVARPSYAADITADRLAGYTGDPYQGGCSVVSSLARPRRALWRSCDERVATFAPGGRSMATIDLLADGIGPRVVWQRRVHGRLLARHSAPRWFGRLWWESPRALLLDVNARSVASTVRCTREECENATDLRTVPDLL